MLKEVSRGQRTAVVGVLVGLPGLRGMVEQQLHGRLTLSHVVLLEVTRGSTPKVVGAT